MDGAVHSVDSVGFRGWLMFSLSFVAAMSLAAVTLTSLAAMLRFVMFYCANQQVTEEVAAKPDVAVVLSLRGVDPSLESCLTALLAQNYDRYSVFIVIDNGADPARSVVESVLARSRSKVEVKIDFLRDPGVTRSLKVSALLQAIAQLRDDVEIVALLDSDAIPTADWLGRLVAPMADPKVGAVSGLRWYLPQEESWGSLIRYAYNAISCLAAYALNVPWAGSLAFRRRDLERCNLLRLWARSFSDDASTCRPLRAIGQRLAFVNSGILPSTESADLGGAYRQIVRHMLCMRLCHSSWPLIVLLALGNLIVILLCFLLLVSTSTIWQWKLAIAILLCFYWAGMYAALVVIDRTVAAGSPTRRPALLNVRRILALALIVLVMARAAIAAMFTRSIEWRGIRYVVDGGGGVHMLVYRPFASPVDTASTHSIL
ncbi:MAG TPA: glycosyltransferase family 2 protein [Xanthobacteraceae bacterium]|nr:glycosyltransferase family 2 protein [Xanthobacteraceae bacterium]